ncbi:DUF4189 domain-containing protein [Nocardia sp. NPDC051030]|uniref:DUF4189 domain-containing protein n=1 Tax=Nocardia sp. NPDC051030 TaxID=3155162 RepID=UPI0034222374
MKKILSGAAVLVAVAGTLLAGTAAPASADAVYNGAIALSPSTGHYAYSTDYDSMPEAKAEAMRVCGFNDCRVVSWFSNGCGAIAYSSRAGLYTYGAAYSRTEAKNQALNKNRSGATIIHWSCTTGYQL